ncbi:hypothetical protein, partial [Xenorhabdus khoisanae]|uniref:hypothetical protein n=1 Tax=Xenorhabdus khoisanae TaxID=880157 RepID=UPI00128D2CE5
HLSIPARCQRFSGWDAFITFPRFCNTDFDVGLACLNLSGVSIGKDARATMSFAPDEPENDFGLDEPFLRSDSSSGR